MNIELTDEERQVLYDLVVDHPMWKHDGVELEYDPEREGLIGMFLDSEAHIVASIAAAKVAGALRDAAEQITGTGAATHTISHYLRLKADEYEKATDAVV
jgi:hypothetical protein